MSTRDPGKLAAKRSAIIFESAERLGERIRDVMTFDPDREDDLPPGEVSAVHRAARAALRGGTS